jgi:sulfonate transport system permease protein
VRRLYGPLLLLAGWQVACSAGWLRPDVFPPPSSVLQAAQHLIGNGELQSNLWSSLHRVLLGLAFGIITGTMLAVAAGLTRRGEDLIDSTVQVIKSIPIFAVIPLLITWLGIGEEPKIVLIAVGTGLVIYVNTYGAIRGVDAQLVEAARTLGVGRVSLILNVVLPGSIAGFLVGLRLALASAWLSLIFAETINTQSGIGFLMTEAEDQFQLGVMVLLVVVYAVIGLLGYGVVRLLERSLLAWRQGFEGA